MTLQIELDPETEAQLTQQAQDKGENLETYAFEILKAATPSQGNRKPTPPGEFRATLESFAAAAPDLSHLRDETFSRAMIYGDHD